MSKIDWLNHPLVLEPVQIPQLWLAHSRVEALHDEILNRKFDTQYWASRETSQVILTLQLNFVNTN